MKELVIKAQKGDKRAENLLMKSLLKTFSSRTTNKEIIQTACIKVFNHLDKFDFEKGVFSHWISRIMSNEIKKEYNKFSKEGHVLSFYTMTDLDSRSNSRSNVDYNEQKEIDDSFVYDLIEELKPAQKQVFKLYELEGLSHQEIADYLGVSDNTSKTNLMRAKENLRKKIIRDHGRSISRLQYR